MRISDWSSDVCSSDLLSRARYEDTGQTVSRPLQGERLRGAEPARWVVRKGGLEPPRLAAPAPKAGASTNSATFATPGSLPVQARFYARGGEGGKEAKKSTSPDSGERVPAFFLIARVAAT